jgi:hypothetical protein
MIARRLTIVVLAFLCVFGLLQTPSFALGPKATAISGLQSCIAVSKSLNLVFLVDTSGSLQQTDPRNVRVAAVKAEIAALKSASQMDGTAVAISLIGFASTASVVQPWTNLTSGSEPRLMAAAQRFASMNTGATTDFPNGLSAAWSQIIHATTLRPSSCSAVLWFTDGRIDLGPSVSHEAAVREMCRSGSPADTLAAGGVYTFAVGLGDAGGLKPSDATELQSYVEGGGNDVSQHCGRAISASTGQFFSVSNAAFLTFALQAALDPSVPQVPKSAPVCLSAATCSPVAQPWIGPGVGGVRIVASTEDGAPLSLVVTSPHGSVRLDSALTSATISGVGVTYQTLSTGSIQASLNVTNPGLAKGTWSLQFLASHPTQVYYWVGLLPSVTFAVLPGQSFTRGSEPAPGTIVLIDAKSGLQARGLIVHGLVATVSGLGDLTAPAESLQLEPRGDAWRYQFLNAFPDNAVTVSMTADLIVGPTKHSIPLQQTVVEPAPLPADYPTVTYLGSSAASFQVGTPEVLHFSVAASNGTSGCVRSVSAVPLNEQPGVTASPNLATRTSCAVVAPGSPVLVNVKVTTTNPAAAIFPVVAKFELQGRPTSQWIESRTEVKVVMTKPLNVAKSLLIFALVLVMGIGLLIGVLKVLNRKYAKLYPAPRSLISKTYSVAIAGPGDGVIFLSRLGDQPGQPIDFMNDRPDALFGGFTDENELLEPAPAFSFPENGSTYDLSIRPLGPFGLLTLFSGALRATVRRSDGSEFLAGLITDKSNSATCSGSQQFDSTVIKDSWFFVPEGSWDQPDVMTDSEGFILATAPYVGGRFTVLLNDPDQLDRIVDHAKVILKQYYDAEWTQERSEFELVE